MQLKEVHIVYMLGIGGIGMSALARYLHRQGKQVSGYDRTETPLTQALCAEGISVHYDTDIAKIGTPDIVIYTPAISPEFALFKEVQKRDIPLKKRSEVLGMISREFKTIAVAGTHGKTSTSAMITHLMRECGIECTGFVGGIMKNFASNFVFGKSEWLVVEADEFDRSFLHLNPDILIITSIDPDHLDIYGSHEAVDEAYKLLTERLKPSGTLILNDRLQSFAQDISKNALFYGLETGDNQATGISVADASMKFNYVSENEEINDIQLNLPGRYNIENATAAITAVLLAGGDKNKVQAGINAFSGIKRRFDIQYLSNNITYVDDYAHHPEEIKVLVEAAREIFKGREITAIFQPHLYSRTRDFASGFAESLSLADNVILVDIYPAREEPIAGVSSEIIFKEVTSPNKEMTTKQGLMNVLEKYKADNQVVLSIGAGDIDTKVSEIKTLVETW